MKTIQNLNEQKSANFLDRSLYEWVPRSELAQMVPQIIRLAPNAHKGTRHEETVLAILVYCYAIGIYRSQEIEQRLRRSRGQGQLLPGSVDGKVLAQYRRSHGPLLKQCLAIALRQAFLVKWTKSRAALAQTASNSGSELESEAERRLEVAEAWDLFDQDGLVGKSDHSDRK